MRKSYIVIVLLLLAAFVRLYRIADYTEFLGDQGSAGMVIYQSLQEKALPLAGPIISTGQRPGPFFYYLSALPLILFRFNPIAPAVFMALIGVCAVYLLYLLASKLFTPTVAAGIAFLYALSPPIVGADRIWWNPTPIPFLVLLLLVAMYKIASEKKYEYFLLVGMTSGLAVQLHYTALFHVMSGIVFTVFMIVSSLRRDRIRQIGLWSLAGLLGFMFVLSPFLYYESARSYTDLKDLALLILYPNPAALSGGTVPVWQKWSDVIVRLFVRVAALPTIIAGVLAAASLVHAFLIRKKWLTFIGLWFLSGIAFVSLYKGTLFDHYLYFLLPFPFLLFGGMLVSVEKRISRGFLYGFIACLAVLNIAALVRSGKDFSDIQRTKMATGEIIRQAADHRFAFALISSRSFSDLHYRYYFLMQKEEPEALADGVYDTLFLVCETDTCPTLSVLAQQNAVPVVCYDYYCEGKYPNLDMTQWQFIRSVEGNGAIVYTFLRGTSEREVMP